MKQVQVIKATEARNNFFELLKLSYLHEKSFLVEKGGIPMVKITPVGKKTSSKKKMSKKEYLNLLLNLDTSWFTEEDYQDYLKVRQEVDAHFTKNSL